MKRGISALFTNKDGLRIGAQLCLGRQEEWFGDEAGGYQILSVLSKEQASGAPSTMIV